MKKILYSTTALVAATLIASSAMADGFATSKKSSSSMTSKQVKATSQMQTAGARAKAAQGFTVNVGGFANWYAGYIDNDIDGTNEFDVMGDAEIHFNVETTLNNGLKIGGTIELEGGTDMDTSTNTIDQSFVYVESKYGKLVAGRHDNVSKQLHKSAFDVGALDIQESDLTRLVIGTPADDITATYVMTSDNQVALSYFTPKYMGFQGGVTYAPAGDGNPYDATSVRGAFDATIFTVGYDNKFGGFDVAVTGTYAFTTDFAPQSKESTDQYAIGARVGFQGFTLSGGYKHVNYQVQEEANVWDVGLAYEQGPYGVSLAYLTGKNNVAGPDDEKVETWLLSAKYNLAAGVDSFATFGYGKYENVPVDNKGWTIIGGMMLSF